MRYIIYIASIMLITMLMIYIGIMKERTLSVELTNRLYRKCSITILKYLRSHEQATIFDIQNCIKSVHASVIWSKKRISITNPGQFADYVVDNMYKQGKLIVSYKGNTKLYSIKK